MGRVCDHVECIRDEPDDLVAYKLRGTIQPVIRRFCTHHDPRQDPRNGELWEVYDADLQAEG